MAKDANFENVSLLLYMEGEDGGTTFPDASPSPKTVSVFGNTKLSLDEAKFGEVSAFFDGAGDYLTVPYTSAAFGWFDTSYTLEAWVYPVALDSMSYSASGSVTPLLISNSAMGSLINYWCFGPTSSGTVALRYFDGVGAVIVTSTETVSEGAWSHVALVFDDGEITIFVNGVLSGQASVSSTPQDNPLYPLRIGATNANYMHAYVAGLRITQGVARYTASFTPPATPWPGIGYLAGVVEDSSGAPAARLVRAVREDTGAFVGGTTSDATTGAYSIPATIDGPHTLIAYPASLEDLPALIHRGVIPE